MFKSKFNSLKAKIIAFFTYKGKKMRVKTGLYAKYLSRRKFDLMGIKKIVDHSKYATVIDKTNNEYFVVSLTLKKQNGLNFQTDDSNYAMVEHAKSYITGKTKIISLADKTNALQDNIAFVKALYEREEDSEIKNDILDRLEYLEELDRHGEEKCYMFIEIKDFEIALNYLSQPYYYNVLSKAELQELLFRMQNVI